MKLRDEVLRLLPLLKQWREQLHQIPECNTDTVKTKAYLKKIFDPYPVTCVEDVLENSLIVELDQHQEEWIVFRCDMDALPIKEENEVAYCSLHEGMMHACGHDGHMAMGIGLFHYLMEHRSSFDFNFMWVFQPAEETFGGGRNVAEWLKSKKICSVFATHLQPQLPLGRIGACSRMMGMSLRLRIDIKGRKSHGAMPHLGKDTLNAATFLIDRIHCLRSQELSPFSPIAICIGQLTAGKVENVICDEAFIKATIRTLSISDARFIQRRIEELCLGIEYAYGLRIVCRWEEGYPCLVNRESALALLKRCVDVEDVKPQLLCDDFAYYLHEFDGLYFYTGCQGGSGNLHEANFDFDSSCLLYGVETFIRLIEEKQAIKKEISSF